MCMMGVPLPLVAQTSYATLDVRGEGQPFWRHNPEREAWRAFAEDADVRELWRGRVSRAAGFTRERLVARKATVT